MMNCETHTRGYSKRDDTQFGKAAVYIERRNKYAREIKMPATISYPIVNVGYKYEHYQTLEIKVKMMFKKLQNFEFKKIQDKSKPA